MDDRHLVAAGSHITATNSQVTITNPTAAGNLFTTNLKAETLTANEVHVKADNFQYVVNIQSILEKLDDVLVDHSVQLSNLFNKVSHWVDREDVIEQMIEKRKNGPHLAITGLAGSGKTQLARYYLEQISLHRKKSQKKLIVREFVLEEKDGLKEGYIEFIHDIERCNPMLNVSAANSLDRLTEEDLLKIIIGILRRKYSDHEIIFFYDNVDSDTAIDIIRETVKHPYFINQVCVVITSQRENFFPQTQNKEQEIHIHQGLTIIQSLKAFNRYDLAEKLLALDIQKDVGVAQYFDVINILNRKLIGLNSSDQRDSESIRLLLSVLELIHMFDYLPLAIVAARIYIEKEQDCSIEDYKILVTEQNRVSLEYLEYLENINDLNMKNFQSKKIGICSQISALSLAIKNMDSLIAKRKIGENFEGIMPSAVMKIIACFSNNGIPDFFVGNILMHYKKKEDYKGFFVTSFSTVLKEFSLLPLVKTISRPSGKIKIFSFHSQTFLAARSLISEEEKEGIFTCAFEIIRLAGAQELDKKSIEANGIIGENFITLLTNHKMPVSDNLNLILNYLDTIYDPILLVKFLQKMKNIASESQNDKPFIYGIMARIYENIINSYAEMNHKENRDSYISEFNSWISGKTIQNADMSVARIALHASNMKRAEIVISVVLNGLDPTSYRSLKSNAFQRNDADKLKIIALLEDNNFINIKIRINQGLAEEIPNQALPSRTSFEYIVYLFRRACIYLYSNQFGQSLDVLQNVIDIQRISKILPEDFFCDVLITKVIVHLQLMEIERALAVLSEINSAQKQRLYLECLVQFYKAFVLQENSAEIPVGELIKKLDLLKKGLAAIPEEVYLLEIFLAEKQGQHENCLSILAELNQGSHLRFYEIVSFSSNISRRWLFFFPKIFSLISSNYVKLLLKIDVWAIQENCLAKLKKYKDLSILRLKKIKEPETTSGKIKCLMGAFEAYKLSGNSLKYNEVTVLFEPLLSIPDLKEFIVVAKLWMQSCSQDAVHNYEKIMTELFSVEKTKRTRESLSLRIFILDQQRNYSDAYKLIVALQDAGLERTKSPFILDHKACGEVLSSCFSYFESKGDVDRAIECYNRLHKEKTPDQYVVLGQLYLRKKDYRVALDNFHQALTAMTAGSGLEGSISRLKKILAGIFCDIEGFYSDQNVNAQEKIDIYRKYSKFSLGIYEVYSCLMCLLLNQKEVEMPQLQEIKNLRMLLIKYHIYDNSDMILAVSDFLYEKGEFELARDDYRRYITLKSFLYTFKGEVPKEKLKENEGCFCKQVDGIYAVHYNYNGPVKRSLKSLQEMTKFLQNLDKEGCFSEEMRPICDFIVINQISRFQILPEVLFTKGYSSQTLIRLSDAMLHLSDLEGAASTIFYVETHDKVFIDENKVFVSEIYRRMAKQMESGERNIELIKGYYRKSIMLNINNLLAIQDEKAFLLSIKDYSGLIANLENKYSGYRVGWSAECEAVKQELFDTCLEYVGVLGMPDKRQQYLQRAVSLYPGKLQSLFLLIKVLIKNNQLLEAFNKFSGISVSYVTPEYLYEYNILAIIIYTKKKDYEQAVLSCNKAMEQHGDKVRFIKYLSTLLEVSRSKDQKTIQDANLQKSTLLSAVANLSFMSIEEKQNLEPVFTSIDGYFKEYETFEFFDGLPYFYYCYVIYLKNASESAERIVDLYNDEDVSKKDDLCALIASIKKSVKDINKVRVSCDISPATSTFFGERIKTRFEKLKGELLDHVGRMLFALESRDYRRFPSIICVNHCVKTIEDLKQKYYSRRPDTETSNFFKYYDQVCSIPYLSDLFDDDRCAKLSLLLNWYSNKSVDGNWDQLLQPAIKKSKLLCDLRYLKLCKKVPEEEAIEQAIKRYRENQSRFKGVVKAANYYDKSEAFINNFYNDMFSVLEEEKPARYRKKIEEFSLSIPDSYPSDLNNLLKEELRHLDEKFQIGLEKSEFNDSFYFV